MNEFSIALRHVLPNALTPPLIVLATAQLKKSGAMFCFNLNSITIIAANAGTHNHKYSRLGLLANRGPSDFPWVFRGRILPAEYNALRCEPEINSAEGCRPAHDKPVRKSARAPPRLRRCGTEFSCNPSGPCWCSEEAFRLPMPVDGGDCLCPDCLRKAAAAAASP